jgi:hypothetical protein
VEEDPDGERAGENLPRVPTTRAANTGVSQSGECREDLLWRDRLPQPEPGGAPSVTNFHKIACITQTTIKRLQTLTEKLLAAQKDGQKQG